MKKRTIVCALLLFLLAFSTFQLRGVTNGALQQPSAGTSKQPTIIDGRDMTFFSEMQSYANITQKNDWTAKIYPADVPRLEDNLFKDSYLQVYVSDVNDTVQLSKNRSGEVKHSMQVYVPSDRIIKQLSNVPHTVFYVSMYTPSISMVVDKQGLEQIANNTSVYCIRILPQTCETLGTTINDARTYDTIAYTMNKHTGGVVGDIDIAIIDTGYDPYQSFFNYCADDNIVYRHDFSNGDDDVTDGDNSHGTAVLDLMAQAFGDTGENDDMYENSEIYSVLKVSYENAPGLNSTAIQQAIEYCLSHDIEITCMSFGGPFHGTWCNLFKDGTGQGITWVAGAGNDNSYPVLYPANSHYVVAVGAYSQISGLCEAESYSSFGIINYSSCYLPCQTCSDCQQTAFKPNVYECGEINDSGVYLLGTSFADSFACADIAIGFYSSGEYTGGYENLLATLVLCAKYPVTPSECSLQGDVISTDTLWHGEAYNLIVGCSPALYGVAIAAAPSFLAYYNSLDLDCCINNVTVIETNDASDVFDGLQTGEFNVGLADRLPTYNELPDAQVWAIGNSGVLLWAVTTDIPYCDTPQVAESVWISYLKLPDPANHNYLGDYSGNLNFISQQGYQNLLRDDLTDQTFSHPSFPNYVIDAYDLYYCLVESSNCINSGTITPYVDMNANGHVGDAEDYDIFSNNY